MSWKFQKVLSWWILTSLYFESLDIPLGFFNISYIYSGASCDILTKKTYIITQISLDILFLIQTIRYVLYFDNFDRDIVISTHESDLFKNIYPWIWPFWYLPLIWPFFLYLWFHESDLFFKYLFMNLTFFYIYPWIRPFLYLSMNLSFFDIYQWIFDLFDIYQMNESVTFFDTSSLWLL